LEVSVYTTVSFTLTAISCPVSPAISLPLINNLYIAATPGVNNITELKNAFAPSAPSLAAKKINPN